MTPDLAAIDVLSTQFYESIHRLERFSSGGAIILPEGSPEIEQGQKILRMYEAESRAYPDDPDVRDSYARHLYRIGWLYYEALDPRFLPRPGGDSDSPDTLRQASVRNAKHTCEFMHASYVTVPTVGAALVLADVFRLVRFYGTAIHWLKKVEEGTGDDETINKAKAKRLDLQSDGKTSDPPLPRRPIFPTPDTPGLVLELQPASPPPTVGGGPSNGSPLSPQGTSGKGTGSSGCLAALIAAAIIGILCAVGVVSRNSAGHYTAAPAAHGRGVAMRFVQSLPSPDHHKAGKALWFPTTSHVARDRGRGAHESQHIEPMIRRGVLTEDMISGRSDWDLTVMRNEPFARKGYIFRRADLRRHFMAYSWYHPTERDQDKIWRTLTPVERTNLNLIAQYCLRLRTSK